MTEGKKHSWHGPKQIGMMVFTAVLFLIGTSIIGGNNNTVFPAFAEIRGWNLDIMNAVSGIACILKSLGVLAFAGLIRKTGAKKLIAVTLFLSAALLLVFGKTNSLPVFLTVILIIGFLGGAYEKNGGMTLTANWWPTKKGVVLGFTTMGIVAMNFLYVPYMPVLIKKFGPFGAMGVIAGLLAVVAVICLICIKNNPEEAGEYPDGDPTYAINGAEVAELMRTYKSPFTPGKVLKDKNTWLIGLGSGFAFMAVMSYIASAIPAMMSFGYTYKMASGIFALGGIMGIIGSFIFGMIDQRSGTKKAFIGYFIFILVGFVLLLAMPLGPAFCWASGIIIFAAQGALCNLLPSYVATIYGRWDYNAGYQMIGFIFEVFAGIGVMMTGFFHNFTAMYILDLVLMVFGLIFMIFSKDTFIGKE
jgi:OFA family oxalate/formate antiporter-like MFS transporter